MRLAELAAIAVLLIAFGMIVVSDLPLETKAAGSSAIVTALVLLGRSRRR